MQGIEHRYGKQRGNEKHYLLGGNGSSQTQRGLVRSLEFQAVSVAETSLTVEVKRLKETAALVKACALSANSVTIVAEA